MGVLKILRDLPDNHSASLHEFGVALDGFHEGGESTVADESRVVCEPVNLTIFGV